MITVDVDSLDDFVLVDNNGQRYKVVKENEAKSTVVEPLYIKQSHLKKIYGIGQAKLDDFVAKGDLIEFRENQYVLYKTAELKILEDKGKIIKKRVLA